MKVSIRSLGVIKEAQFELKPLTVVVGPNNAGKTWLAYSLAGILGPFGSVTYAQAYADKEVPKKYDLLDTAIEQLLTKGNSNVDLRRFAEELGETYFNEVARYARNWMGFYHGTAAAHFDEFEISFKLGEGKRDFLRRVTQYARTNRLAGGILTIQKEKGNDKVFAFTSTDGDGAETPAEQLGEKIPLKEVREHLISFFFRAIHESLYAHTHVFPTERTTLVILPFAVSSARRTLAGAVHEKELDTEEATEQIPSRPVRGPSFPIALFSSMLRSFFASTAKDRERRERESKREPKIKRYMQFAEILETQILTGNVSFSLPEPDPKREIVFQPTEGPDLEIPMASSMVKELAPLVLYLRLMAKPNDLLVIDEPEVNLHPAAQVKLMELFAMLVNEGLNVLFTTHSPYMVDHLVNLMDAHKHKQQDKIVELFRLKRKEAFIAQDKVSVYLVEAGEVKDVLSPEGEIDWRTFSDVTTQNERIHFELLGE